MMYTRRLVSVEAEVLRIRERWLAAAQLRTVNPATIPDFRCNKRRRAIRLHIPLIAPVLVRGDTRDNHSDSREGGKRDTTRQLPLTIAMLFVCPVLTGIPRACL